MSTPNLKPAALALACAAALLPASQALAAEFWLRAVATSVAMPNPDGSAAAVAVPMWGYQSCTGFAVADTCSAASVPGPALNLPAGDSTLTVYLANDLAVPTSLVVNGLLKPMAPTFTTDAQGRRRVRSFDAEVAAGNTGSYTWANAKPGTYLYQSGTQVQVQVQMGLYGAVSQNAVDANAQSGTRAQSYPGAAYQYDNQATLFYSEIDPALHAAVADSSYGTSAGPTSTFNYQPKYFLVNGQPFPGNAVIAPVGAPGTTLLRLLNAGLVTHVPMVDGLHWSVVAEDGKPYSFAARQYTALLPAAKTLDVMLTPTVDIGGGATYAVLDRRLHLSNSGLPEGGMLAFLRYGAQGVSGAAGLADNNAAPLAGADSYSAIQGVALTVAAADGVLANDSDPDSLPLPLRAVAGSGATAAGGSFVLKSDGSFTFTPAEGFTGTSDSFTYLVTDGKALSLPATVTVNLSVPAAPALALRDDFDRPDASSLGTSSVGTAWSQQVGTTTSAPDLGITNFAAKANTAALGGLAILNQVFTATQGAGFSFASPLAESAVVLKATGGTPTAPANYVRVRCESTGTPALVIATLMGGSNVSVFVRQASFPLAACGNASGALSAVVDAKGVVTAFVNGQYAGGVQLPDVAAWKGQGKIGLQLQGAGASADNFAGGSL